MEDGGNSWQTVQRKARRKQKWEIDLLVNHFKVDFPHDKEIFCYKVDIAIAPSSQGASGSETNTSTALKRYILNKFIKDNLRNRSAVYDGIDNLYSPTELEQGDFTVEPYKDKKYRLKLERVASSSIMDFLGSESGHVMVKQELLKKLDAGVKEYLRENYTIVGQGFYEKPSCRDYGTAAENGFSMSLRPTVQGLNLIVDYSVAAFYVEIAVLKYLEANGIRIPLDAERALTGLKVTVEHRKPGQRFTVVGLTKQVTKDIKFNTHGQEQEKSIVDYYNDRYGKPVKNVEFPCLDLSPGEQNYVPMEFCKIWEGQRVLKGYLNSEQEEALKTIVKLWVRRNKIAEIMGNEKGPARCPYLASYEMTVPSGMTEVRARILDAPVLKLGNENLTPRDDKKRQWNLTTNRNTVLFGMNITGWGIILFSNKRKDQIDAVNKFKNQMVRRFIEVGINIAPNPIVFEVLAEDTLNDGVKLKTALKEILRGREKELEILICVIQSRDIGYKILKLICETEIGLATQCCLFENVRKCAYPHDSFPNFPSQCLVNIALKVNAKLGGSNVALKNPVPGMEDFDVLYFGADVNHPTNHDKECPSIAAVVMSINSKFNRYVVRIQRQKHRQGIISNLGNMCYELLVQKYADTDNRRLPERIIFFRDGVGDWQFDEVRNKELVTLKDAFKEFGKKYYPEEDYNPKLTFILAQKRHHTRLFQKSGDEDVPSGTVVDSAEIVHPAEVNFYLCSHYNKLATSKATHYYVLCNEIGFNSEDLQRAIYHLCFTLATFTNPVSLVPPVHYADRAAYRGRMYVEAQESGISSLNRDASLNVLLGGDKSMFFI